jgi:uncharacterized protein (TIGR02145 family)
MKLKIKLGISFISIASVMLYVGCSSSDSSTSAPENLAAIDEVESLDDLLNCTSKKEGNSVQVKEESAIYVCSDGEWEKWRSLTDTLSTADDLLACLSKREGNTAFVTEENALYKCVDGSWEKIVTGTFTDTRDGQIYKTVKIGDQVWMAENLNYKIDGSYCYESFTQNCEKYGRLYSKLSALHACPEGWHLPSGKEFRILLVNVGGADVAGRMLKSPTDWYDYNGESGNGIDAFGFNALPAGYFSNDNGDFISAHEEAYFLGATDDWSEETAMLNLMSDYRGVSASQLSEKKEDGFSYYSVRCLQDSNNESVEKEPVAQCEEKKLSKACLQGEWYFSTLDGAMLSYAGAGILKFSDSRFRYTPAVADLAHTYCPGTELEGTYDIISLTQIKLTVGGIRLYDCFIGKKEIIVNATISENKLRLSGIEESPFVPNDEGLKTEIYNRTEDSSSNAEESTSSSSAAQIEMSSASEVSPVVMDKLGADVMSDGQGGEMVQLKGTIRLDDGDNFNIDSLRFIAGHVENGIVYESPLRVPRTITFPTDRIALGTSTAKIQLAPLEGCGDFRIYVWAYASASEEGGLDVSKVPVYSSVDSVDFVKACPKEEVSSSSVDAACTEVVATEVTLSNILETDQYAINLVTGLAENPHLTLEIVDNMAYFQAAPGVEIWEEERQDFGLLPESPVCLESFKIAFGSQANRLELMGNMWLYIKTPEGYFPMMLGKVKYQGEKTGSVSLTYYK